jgi:hypothetical protein
MIIRFAAKSCSRFIGSVCRLERNEKKLEKFHRDRQEKSRNIRTVLIREKSRPFKKSKIPLFFPSSSPDQNRTRLLSCSPALLQPCISG